MKNGKQVIDFRASKGFTVAQSNEHLRVYSDKTLKHALSIGNYDLTREHLNFEVVKGGKIQPVDKTRSIPQRIAENLASRGINDPNEGLAEPRFRTVVNFILGGSRDRMLELAFGDQKVEVGKDADNSHLKRSRDIEQWAKDMYYFVSDRYGEENIAAFVVHMDETNPHVHLTLLPIDRNGKFAYKKIFAGKDKFEFKTRTLAMHDAFAKVNAKWGLDRGTSITETGARHRSTEEYRRMLDEECSSLADDIEKHRRVLSGLQKDIALAERRVKGLTSMIANLEREKADVERELDSLATALLDDRGGNLSNEEKAEALRAKLEDINTKLADKREKLSEAEDKLAQLKEEETSIRQRTEELRSEAVQAATEVQSKVRDEVTRALYENVVSDFRLRLPQFTDEMHLQLDDSVLMDVAEKGNNIVRCAMLLFAGYVDQATEFAKGHGGSGNTPSSGWGRDPKDDDREWARRCAMMATRMMRSGLGRKMKR